MDITRHNYEEYFILYIDNELNAAERKAVELFVQENPDLEEELIMLQQSVIRPDANMTFTHKEMLLKDTASQGPVNEGNYEEYFVLYGDGELTNEEKDLVEQFVYKYPQYQAEFELIQQARLFPESMNFPDKAYLYRTEEDDNKVVPFGWWRMIAASVVLLIVGTVGWRISMNKEANQPAVVVTEPKTVITEKQEPVVAQQETVEMAEPVARVAAKPETTGKNQKIFAVNSNKPKEENVQPIIVQTLKPEEEPATNLKQLAVKQVATVVEPYTPPVVKVEPAISQPASATAIAAAMSDDMNNDKTYVLNTSVNKTPLRGFFRKVSRVVDKATSFEVSENEKGGVRIANFELALK